MASAIRMLAIAMARAFVVWTHEVLGAPRTPAFGRWQEVAWYLQSSTALIGTTNRIDRRSIRKQADEVSMAGCHDQPAL
jgi:hypothetical protein